MRQSQNRPLPARRPASPPAGNTGPPQSQAPDGKTPGQPTGTSQQSQAAVRNPRPENRTSMPKRLLNTPRMISNVVFEKSPSRRYTGIREALYGFPETTCVMLSLPPS